MIHGGEQELMLSNIKEQEVIHETESSNARSERPSTSKSTGLSPEQLEAQQQRAQARIDKAMQKAMQRGQKNKQRAKFKSSTVYANIMPSGQANTPLYPPSQTYTGAGPRGSVKQPISTPDANHLHPSRISRSMSLMSGADVQDHQEARRLAAELTRSRPISPPATALPTASTSAARPLRSLPPPHKYLRTKSLPADGKHGHDAAMASAEHEQMQKVGHSRAKALDRELLFQAREQEIEQRQRQQQAPGSRRERNVRQQVGPRRQSTAQQDHDRQILARHGGMTRLNLLNAARARKPSTRAAHSSLPGVDQQTSTQSFTRIPL